MSRTINPAFPLETPRSVVELMAVALGMEREAHQRYEDLTARMERAGDARLAATFRNLADLERQHRGQLEAWATRESRVAPEPRQFRWLLPETFDAAGEDAEPLDPYRALAIAVRNEERAFSFYSYLAAVTDSPVRERAEALAREELGHIALLRRMRRQAYHENRPVPDGREQVGSIGDLHRVALGLEQGAASLCRMLADRLADRETPLATLISVAGEQAAGTASTLAGKVGEGAAPPASTIVEMARATGLLATPGPDLATLFGLCERDAREALDVYLAIADAARSEDILVAAQDLAEKALARVSLIRSHRGEQC